ncbi:uncharacterized protein LOC110621528 [Manihot esculenta]|uniref:uncharacterized protein LOC110621528 n=1 Tax=Manihot esculenta TaxID=3983 RepID=UPI000B5D722F|nr:uncharacterized protein LOC110621528 [Manihot esculenta]
MFGGVAEASNPRLLALTGLLASSTQEQVAFRSWSREQLGDTTREMLLMAMGIFMEIDARDRALKDSVDRRIEEARLEENLSATSDARSNLAATQEHSKSLQVELSTALEALKRADGRAAAAEISRDKALEQLSSLEEVRKERDEATRQKEEVQHQHELLKADFEGAQAHCEAVMAQREEALARVVVLEQELVKQADNFKDLTLEAETTKLQNQVQLECEKRLWEYKESAELKREIEQACEAHLQIYKDSYELKTKIAEACKERLVVYKASDEMKNAIWHKGFRIFVSGFNRGLRTARYALSTPLAELRATEVDSDGEDVLYGEDDMPLPKGAHRTAAGPPKADAELRERDDKAAEDAGPQGREIVPFVGTGGSEQKGSEPPIDSSIGDSVDNVNVPRRVSPLRTVFPSVE